jgi:tetratricopeptide (TPR) repeat protein
MVKPGRNDPCPCGSGKKYKACCGRVSAATTDGAEELRPLVALMTAGRFAELEIASRQRLEAQPASGHAWQLLAVALSRQGKDALQALTRATQYLPQDSVAHLNHGNALARLGRLDEAQLSFRRALAICPDFAEAHQHLGELLLNLGRVDAALLCCRRALEIKPDYAEAHHSMGRALGRLGQIDAAMASFREALGLDPDMIEAHVNLANALRSLGRLADAIAGYRRALRIKPDFVVAHAELGTALRLQGRASESEASCREALRMDPDSAAALSALAELRADTGRFAEAEQLFNRVIAIDPGSVEAWAALARLRRMTAADEAWLVGAQRLAERDLPPNRELLLRYALGKYFDDREDFANAFANYRRANQLAKCCGPAHDRMQLSRAIDLIIRSHTKLWLSRARAANPSPRPVFIVGMLRSGTTLAEQILASHPAVFGAGELTFWAAQSAAAIAAASAADADLDADLDAAGGPMSDSVLARLGNEYLELLRSLSADAPRVVNKLPTNFLFLGLIRAALPEARIIHMRRNPIDTCLSIYFQHFEAANTYATDLEDLAHYYREYRRLMQHWRTALPASALLEVPYEGLVLDLETWSRRLLDFVGLPWHPGCLEFHRTARTVVTASRWQVRQAISAASVERWRHYERFVGPLKSLLDMEEDVQTPISRP